MTCAFKRAWGGLVRLVCEFHIQGLINKQPRPVRAEIGDLSGQFFFERIVCLASSVRTVLCFLYKKIEKGLQRWHFEGFSGLLCTLGSQFGGSVFKVRSLKVRAAKRVIVVGGAF
jgi:hypothetical protein